MYERCLKGGGGAVGAALRRLHQEETPELLAEIVAGGDQELDQLVADVVEECNAVVEPLIAELTVDTAAIIRGLQKEARVERRAVDAAPAATEDELREFMDWARREK
jgi:hypothetical protein